MALTTKALLNTSRQKNDGSFPLIIRVTYNRKIINIPVGISLKEKEWDHRNQCIKSSSSIADNITRLNNKIRSKVAKVYDVIAKLEEDGKINRLSMKDIKGLIESTGKGTGEVYVFDFIQSIIDDLRKAKKNGNAEVYSGLLKKLKKFHTSDRLTFNEINYTFLKKLEVAHYSKENQTGGLSVYLRTLRSVYNRAIKAGYASLESYPFKDYKIKNGDPERRALSEKEFSSFRNLELVPQTPLFEARKLFMASFYMRGMNWMDMCMLKKSNIVGDFERIQYVRSKTGKRFSIKINDQLKEILLSYVSPDCDKDEFLFPVLKKGDSPLKYHETIKNKRKRLNKRLKEIAELLNIDSITIYTARHTYATMGKRRGVPTAIIQESLGHKTEAITQTYLDSFENEVVDGYDELIMEN
tara:strand:- start:24202 stop:25437 length:1236 start_codon:yes stop_codon:yes gene_type:complete